MQLYYDKRDVTRYGEKKGEIVDIDAQHSFGLGSRHRLRWGAGYRSTSDQNNASGYTYGGEVAGQYQATSALTIKGNYSLLRMHLGRDGSSVAAQDHEGQSPRQQGYFGATVTLPRDVEVSGHAYMVGALPYFNVPAYTRLDFNTAWQATSTVRVRVVGQNLLGSHIEFGELPSPANEVRRSVHAALTVGFWSSRALTD